MIFATFESDILIISKKKNKDGQEKGKEN